MQSIILPSDVAMEISTQIQGHSFLKRQGPLGTFVKKRGDFKLAVLEKNQNFEGSRIFVSGASPKQEAIVLAQLWKQARGLSLGYRQRLRLVGIGFRGSMQKRVSSSPQKNTVGFTPSPKLNDSNKQAISGKSRVYPKYIQRNFAQFEKTVLTQSYQQNDKKGFAVLQLKLGYSHDSGYPLFRAENKKVHVAVSRADGRTKGTVVVLSGAEAPLVSEITVQIQNLRKPDIYKGKGIHSEGQVISLKKGKRQG